MSKEVAVSVESNICDVDTSSALMISAAAFVPTLPSASIVAKRLAVPSASCCNKNGKRVCFGYIRVRHETNFNRGGITTYVVCTCKMDELSKSATGCTISS